MTPVELAELVASINYPGWHFTTDGMEVRLGIIDPPVDSRDPDGRFNGLWDGFTVAASWHPDTVTDRIFANIQYLLDHELREHFLVGGARRYDAHDPSVTGRQHDWFVEYQSALAGF